MKLFDAHTHLDAKHDWRNLFTGGGYTAAASASTPQECEMLASLSAEFPQLRCTFGIHPWHAAQHDVRGILPYMSMASAIGEIGMDNEWCDVNLAVQRRVFVSQLEIAEEYRKPVILHTKGCEREIADIVAGLSVPILVHWFSGDGLQKYIDMGCYFTIGPDINTNPAVRNVAKHVPLDRLMVESDGIAGLEWATGKPIAPTDIPTALLCTIKAVAELKGTDISKTAELMCENAEVYYKFTPVFSTLKP